MLLLAKVLSCGIQETDILLGNILTSKYAYCSHIKLASPCVLPHKEWPYLIFPRSCSRRMGCTPLFSEGNCQKLESKWQSQNQIERSLSNQCCRSKEVENVISEKSFIVDLHFSGSDICQFAFELLTFSLPIVWRQFRCTLSNPALSNPC